MINVAFCTDQTYWRPLITSVYSLLINNPQSHFRIFVVSSFAVPATEWRTLERVAASAGNGALEQITFHDASTYAHLPVHSHLSPAIYLRLYLAELLPATVDKVVYLDCDVLVRTNLFEDLWDVELGDAYVGAAMEPFEARQRLPLGFGPDDFYFNAGVMLVNLRRWREENALRSFLAFAEANRAHLFSPDQDILNSVFRGHVVNIGVRWNWQALFPRFTANQLGISEEDFTRWKRDPAIVHYTSRYKPWSWRWAPHYQADYVRLSRGSHNEWKRPDRHLRHLPVKCIKMSQRFLEWHFPRLAGALRSLRQRRRTALVS